MVSDDLLAKTPQKTIMQHVNLQRGLFANFNWKHFVGAVRCSTQKNRHEFFPWKIEFLRKTCFSYNK